MPTARSTKVGSARGFWNTTTTIARFGEVGRGGSVAKFKAEYRRRRKCQEQPKCKAMCVDVCCDEVKRLEARKELKKEIDLYQYEMERANYLLTKSDWAKIQKKRRGY